MSHIEQWVRQAMSKLQKEGLSVAQSAQYIMDFALNKDNPTSVRARVSRPTAKEIDRVLAELIRADNKEIL